VGDVNPDTVAYAALTLWPTMALWWEGEVERPLVVFVDVDDTLFRSFGGKRIPMTLMVERVRLLKEQGATLFLWSSGGAEYCRSTACELGLEDCFDGYLPKPHACIDDVRLEDWRELVELHPNEAQTADVASILARLPW